VCIWRSFINVMCSAFTTNTRYYGWEVYDTPIQLVDTYGVTFSGNSITTDAGCAAPQVNYAAPVYLNNVTHIVGTVNPLEITTGGVTTFATRLSGVWHPIVAGVQATQKTLTR
jgi:hypothetical protein